MSTNSPKSVFTQICFNSDSTQQVFKKWKLHTYLFKLHQRKMHIIVKTTYKNVFKVCVEFLLWPTWYNILQPASRGKLHTHTEELLIPKQWRQIDALESAAEDMSQSSLVLLQLSSSRCENMQNPFTSNYNQSSKHVLQDTELSNNTASVTTLCVCVTLYYNTKAEHAGALNLKQERWNPVLQGFNPARFSILSGSFHQGKWEPVFHLVGQRNQLDYGPRGLAFNLPDLT